MNIKDNFIKYIEHKSEIVFKNYKYFNPVIFEFAVNRYSNKINVFERHKKIFEAMKLVDNSTIIITTSGKRFEHQKTIPSR